MKSIQKRFVNIQTKNSNLSTFNCFTSAIKYQNFCKDRVRKMFNKLVDKDEYAQNEKRALLNFLYELTKCPRRTGNDSEIDSDSD